MDFLIINRIITLILWIAAFGSLIYSLFLYPKSHRRERFFYMMVLGSYVLHVIIFYIHVLSTAPAIGEYTAWSGVIRLHGGLAILFKEIVSIARLKKYDAS